MKKIGEFIHRFFIPKEDNNYRSGALHPDFLSYYLILAIVLTFTFKYFNNHFNSVLGFATDISVEKLYQLTNQQRQQNSLSTLFYNEKLAEAARLKATDMFSSNYWAHYAPSGKTPWDFIISSGYRYEFAGENLAKNFLFSQGVVDAWMASSTHRENILRREYSEVGFAIVNGVLNGEETTLVVQMFGRPQGTTLAGKTSTSSAIPVEKAKQSAPAVENERAPAILAKAGAAKKINLTNISFNFDMIFLTFLGFVLALDFYFAAKYGVVRVTGKNLAHFIFIGFIVVGLVMFTRGKIL